MLVESRAEHLAARALVLETAALCDAGANFSLEASCCKRVQKITAAQAGNNGASGSATAC